MEARVELIQRQVAQSSVYLTPLRSHLLQIQLIQALTCIVVILKRQSKTQKPHLWRRNLAVCADTEKRQIFIYLCSAAMWNFASQFRNVLC